MNEQAHYDHERRLSALEEKVDNLTKQVEKLSEGIENLQDVMTRVDGMRRLVQFLFYMSTLVGGAWLTIYTFFHGGSK